MFNFKLVFFAPFSISLVCILLFFINSQKSTSCRWRLGELSGLFLWAQPLVNCLSWVLVIFNNTYSQARWKIQGIFRFTSMSLWANAANKLISCSLFLILGVFLVLPLISEEVSGCVFSGVRWIICLSESSLSSWSCWFLLSVDLKQRGYSDISPAKMSLFGFSRELQFKILSQC